MSTNAVTQSQIKPDVQQPSATQSTATQSTQQPNSILTPLQSKSGAIPQTENYHSRSIWSRGGKDYRNYRHYGEHHYGHNHHHRPHRPIFGFFGRMFRGRHFGYNPYQYPIYNPFMQQANYNPMIRTAGKGLFSFLKAGFMLNSGLGGVGIVGKLLGGLFGRK